MSTIADDPLEDLPLEIAGEIAGEIPASRPSTGTVDDDDEPEDESDDENEAPIRESSETTEAPEEFELDDEDRS